MARRAFLLIVWALVLLAPAAAQAGNDDGVLLGNEAAMTGGAVTALVADGSAAWYNPAGIAQVQRSSVDVNGSAFVLRIGVAPGLLSSATGRQADGGYVELVSVPSAVTLVRDLGSGVHLGIGIFVPRFTDHTDIVSLEEPTVDGTTSWQLTETVKASEYHVGLSLGFRIDEHLRFGLSLFGVYRSAFVDASFAGGYARSDTAPVAAFGFSARLGLEAFGAELGAGVQWSPIDSLHIGLSVLSPGLNFAAKYRVVSTVVSGTAAGEVSYAFGDEGDMQPHVNLISPARVRLGLGYSWEGGWVSLEGEVQHPVDEPSVGVTRSLLFAIRAGARVRVDAQVSLGFGLFTDRTAAPLVADYGDTHIDFYGGSFGLELRNEHQLGSNEQVSTIEFASTFALRYAVGVGEVGGLRFDAGNSEGALQVVPVPTTVHEISLHVGAATYF